MPTQSSPARAMVSAVPVPSEPNSGGTITNREEAGVMQVSVSSVPPMTPIDRVSGRGPR